MTLEIPVLDCSCPVQLLLQETTRCGIVHSIFRHAINLTFDNTLVVLLSAELPRMPNGIRISTDAFATLVGQVREGMKVQIQACDICWEPRPLVASCHWQREIVAQHVSMLIRTLAKSMPSEGLAPVLYGLLDVGADVPRSIGDDGRPQGGVWLLPTPLARVALPCLRQLACASWQQDRAMLATAVSKLVGLGPGLTPSGDDVLGGFAAVMVLLSPYLSIDAHERVWIAELIAQIAGPRTTLISRVLLDYAAKGAVAEQIGDLLLALARPLNEHDAVWRAAQRVLAFGATSGADTLLGILLALRVLEGGFDERHMI